MSESAAESPSLASSSTQNTTARPAQNPSRDKRKPRKTYHDRLKSERPNDKQSKTPYRQQKTAQASVATKETDSSGVQSVQKPEEEDDPDSELCFICGNSMKGRYYSVAPCNNAFCHNCSLRLRALYKSTNCPFCKTEHETVIFAQANDKSFNEFNEEEFQQKDPKLGILFETEQIWEDSMLLLRFNCPETSCDVACRNWSALKAHVKTAHHRFLCSLCTQNKKVFAHEHILYTSKELSVHFATGEPVKDISLTGFTGHPKCKFCNQSFYSLEEFIQHNRENHERCHVCDQINSHRGLPNPQPRYFVNYNELWKHFQSEHYLCGAPECLEQKFVVFESEIDLKAHIMEVHMGRASKAELRDMRRVEVNFQYNTPNTGTSRRRREEERPLRDVDIASLPRDEQAYYRIQQAQREMAERQVRNVVIPPVRPHGATGQNASAVGSSSTLTAPGRRLADNFPPLGSPQPSPSAPSPQPLTPAPAASLPPDIAARHAAVIEKARQLLNHDPLKLDQFKSQVSSFRRGDSTASELIDSLWDIYNTKLDEFGKLITSTADLFDYDAKPKRTELLGAWHDWKIQMQAANSTAASGIIPQASQRSRILALKSSAKGRQSASTQSVWNRIEAVAASRPVASASVTRRLGAMNLHPSTRPAVPWTGTSTPTPRERNVPPPAQVPVRNVMEDFPSLPTSKPRDRIVLNAAAGPARPIAGWNVPTASTTMSSELPEVIKGKGKKKGKKYLFHVG